MRLYEIMIKCDKYYCVPVGSNYISYIKKWRIYDEII